MCFLSFVPGLAQPSDFAEMKEHQLPATAAGTSRAIPIELDQEIKEETTHCGQKIKLVYRKPPVVTKRKSLKTNTLKAYYDDLKEHHSLELAEEWAGYHLNDNEDENDEKFDFDFKWIVERTKLLDKEDADQAKSNNKGGAAAEDAEPPSPSFIDLLSIRTKGMDVLKNGLQLDKKLAKEDKDEYAYVR